MSEAYYATLHAIREVQLERCGLSDASIDARLIEAGHILHPHENPHDAEEDAA